MSTSVIFRMIAKNPPSLLIAGGILLYLVGAPYNAISPQTASELFRQAKLLIISGILLQILWIFKEPIIHSMMNRY